MVVPLNSRLEGNKEEEEETWWRNVARGASTEGAAPSCASEHITFIMVFILVIYSGQTA